MANGEGRLPSTRKEQIGYILKYYFGNVSFMSYMTFLFAVPFLIFLFFFAYQWTALLNNEEATKASLMLFGGVYGLGIAPLTGVIGVGLSGSYTMMMRMTSDQPCNTKNYWIGIKENGLKFFLYYAILGFLAYIVIFNFFFFYQENIGFLYVFMKFFSLVIFAFMLLVITCASAQQVKYQMKIKDILKNAFILSFKRPISTLIIVFLTILPIFSLLFFSRVVKVVILAILFLFYFGLATLIIVEWYQYIFDEVIHKEHQPDEYHRGLSRGE